MRIYKRGKCWYVDYTYKGRRIRKKVGHSQKVAELTLNDIELKIAKSEHLGIHESKKVLFEYIAEDYLKFSKVNKAFGSYQRDITSLKRNLIPYFKGSYLTDITARAIEEYKFQRLKKVTPSSVNRELACLKHLFSKAIEWEYCDVNPVKKVKLLKEPPGRIRYLEDYEIEALLSECSPQIEPMVVVALHTGMRRSELFNLKWEDIDFNNNIIIVKDSKNNESRLIPMNDTVCKTLKTLYHPENIFVFHTPKGTPYKDVSVGFKGALKRAGIENFRFHDLRHTFASRLAMGGRNLQTIQQLLGHKTIKMTVRYSHLSQSYLRDAVNTLEKGLKYGTNLAQRVKVRKPDVHRLSNINHRASDGMVDIRDLKSEKSKKSRR